MGAVGMPHQAPPLLPVFPKGARVGRDPVFSPWLVVKWRQGLLAWGARHFGCGLLQPAAVFVRREPCVSGHGFAVGQRWRFWDESASPAMQVGQARRAADALVGQRNDEDMQERPNR